MTLPNPKPWKVFIQANYKQLLGAKIAKFAMERTQKVKGSIPVEIMNSDEMPLFKNFFHDTYIQKGEEREYDPDDLQSFTFTRFMPPQLMNYEGTAVGIDPDIFALTDITELFETDLEGHAVGAVWRKTRYKSSVMLMDTAKLKHWGIEKIVEGLKNKTIDSTKLKALEGEDATKIDPMWNVHDALPEGVKMIHTTRKLTQPWKTGLPIDFKMQKMPPILGFFPRKWWHILTGRGDKFKHYQPHPDKKVEQFFLELAKDAFKAGAITEAEVKESIEKGYVRKDLLDKLKS